MNSVRYCQKNKGLEVFAWVVMTSHEHMILRAKEETELENVIRDLKSFTSRKIRESLEDKNTNFESRKEWMLWMMYRAGKKNNNNIDFQFWQQHSHPMELATNKMQEQRLAYIHNNPVEASFVVSPEMWQYSSASDYFANVRGLLEIEFIG